jgi:thioredoxin 1
MNTQYREKNIVQEITRHPQSACPRALLAKLSIIAAVIVTVLNISQITIFEKSTTALMLVRILAFAAVLVGIISASAGLFKAWTCRDSNSIILATVGLLLNSSLLATGFVKPPVKGILAHKSDPVETRTAVSTQSGRKIITQDWTASYVVELTDSTFDEAISGSIVLVDCWAPRCGPCRRMSPIIDELADDYNGQVKVCKLNVDVGRSTAAKLGIRGIPTIILNKNGRIYKKWVGLTDKSAIMLEINKLL